jgi:hypothetical protein
VRLLCVIPYSLLTTSVFGMGTDLSAFLAVYSAVMSGDLTSFSIGGKPPSGLLSSIGLVGAAQGLSNSHNRFEVDASPLRGDLYSTYVMVMQSVIMNIAD